VNPLLALAGGVETEEEIVPPPLPPPSGLTPAPELRKPVSAPAPATAGLARPGRRPSQPPVPAPPVAPLASFPELLPVGSAPLDSLVLNEVSNRVSSDARAAMANFQPAVVTTRVPYAGVLTPRAAAPRQAVPAGSDLRNEALAPAAGPRPSNELRGGVLNFGWLQDYTAAASRQLRPSIPARRTLQSDTAARITLPGPTLPAELLSLSQAGLSAIPGYPRRTASSGLPGWVVSFAVMVLLLIGGVGALSYFVPNLLPNSAASAGPTDSRVTEARSEVRPSAYPLAKFVEVTGFRFVVDLNRRSEVHYLVVNHSGAELNGVNVFVTLRTAGSKAGQPPLCRFSFRAPEMAPFESKEMTSSIDKLTRTVALPDWQDLRADVEIGQ
jgi:hypothetical protein